MKKMISFIFISLSILLLLSSCTNMEEALENDLTLEIGSREEDKEEIQGTEAEDKNNQDKFYAYLERDPDFDTDNKKILVKRAGLVFEDDAKSIDQMGLDPTYFHNGFYAYREDEEGQLMKVDENTICEMYFYFEDEPYEFVSLDILLNELPKEDYQDLFVQIEIEGDYIKYVREEKPGRLMSKVYNSKESDVINNGGIFVKYEDLIYYREYSEESFIQSNIWGDNSENLSGRSRINKLYPNGEIKEIWSGQGHFGIFIYQNKKDGPRIISTRKHVDDFWQEGEPVYTEIFSINLEGEMLDNYGVGRIFALDEERDLAIITHGAESIDILDLKDGKRQLVAGEGYKPIYYDSEDGVIYYQELYRMNYGDIEIFAKTIGGESKRIFSATREDLNELISDGYLGDHNFYRNFRTSGDYIFAHIEAREGSGDMFCGNLSLKIRKDGTGYEHNPLLRQVDWYGLNKAFIHRNDPPFNLEPYGYLIFNQDHISQPLIVLSEENLKELDLNLHPLYGNEYLVLVEDVYYLDGDTFFTVKTGIRDVEEDIGWRMAYKDLKWDVYMLEGESQEIKFLYSH